MSRREISAYVERLPPAPTPQRALFRAASGGVSGRFYGCRLASVFQPIATPAGSLVGHQGLVRCHGEGSLELSPWRLFADAADDRELVHLDRLARTVHALNYFAAAEDGLRLVLAVEQRLLETVAVDHGRHYGRVLAGFGVAPRRVVITLPESANASPWLLAEALANYRRSGYRVAVRAGGVGPESIDAFAHLRPDVVRVRALPAADSQWAETFAAIRGLGAAVHVTHVEDAGERDRLAGLGADWLQGHSVGHPVTLAANAPRVRPRSVPPAPRASEPNRVPRDTSTIPDDLEPVLWTPYW